MAKAAKTLPPQDPLTAGRRALHKRRNAAQDRRDALSLLGRVVVLAAAAPHSARGPSAVYRVEMMTSALRVSTTKVSMNTPIMATTP